MSKSNSAPMTGRNSAAFFGLNLSKRAQFWLLTLLGAAGFLVVWYGAVALQVAPSQFLPMPHQVLRKFYELATTPFAGYVLHQHMMASLGRFLMGFGLAAIIGLPLGLLMGWFRWLDAMVSPIFDGLRFVPPIAWVPFAALWFGTGIGGPTLIIFAGAFPPCLINAYRGAKQIDKTLLEAAQSLNTGAFRMLTEILFPATVPSVIAGLRIGAGLGWMSLIGAELIVASSGMGNIIVKGQSAIATDIVMAGMVAIGLVGAVLDILLRRIEAWLLRNRQKI